MAANRREEFEYLVKLIKRLTPDEQDQLSSLVERKADGEVKDFGPSVVVIDFDSTILRDQPWKGPTTICESATINESALKFIRNHVCGKTPPPLVIYSHRIKYEHGHKIVRNWCVKHGIPDSEHIWYSSNIPRGAFTITNMQ